MEEYRKVVTDYIVEKFEIDKEDEDFTPDVNMFEYGFIDSAGAVQLMAFIEQKYGIQVTNKDLMMYPMNTINEIAKFIERKISNK